MCEYIEKLRTLTPNLPPKPFSDLRKKVSDGMVTYHVKEGVMLSTSLYNEEISIAKTFISENAQLENHFHDGSYEVIIILEGTLEVTTEQETKRLTKFDKIELNKSQPHSAVAITDCWFVALTVPRDYGFPQ